MNGASRYARWDDYLADPYWRGHHGRDRMDRTAGIRKPEWQYGRLDEYLERRHLDEPRWAKADDCRRTDAFALLLGVTTADIRRWRHAFYSDLYIVQTWNRRTFTLAGQEVWQTCHQLRQGAERQP